MNINNKIIHESKSHESGERHVAGSANYTDDLLEPEGLGITEVDQSVQKDLHDTIYNSSWGIKAVSPVTEKAKSNFALIDGMTILSFRKKSSFLGQ